MLVRGDIQRHFLALLPGTCGREKGGFCWEWGNDALNVGLQPRSSIAVCDAQGMVCFTTVQAESSCLPVLVSRQYPVPMSAPHISQPHVNK